MFLVFIIIAVNIYIYVYMSEMFNYDISDD